VILAQFQDLGIDEALDQTKDIGVAAASPSDSGLRTACFAANDENKLEGGT
jgi:hypothetical protein